MCGEGAGAGRCNGQTLGAERMGRGKQVGGRGSFRQQPSLQVPRGLLSRGGPFIFPIFFSPRPVCCSPRGCRQQLSALAAATCDPGRRLLSPPPHTLGSAGSGHVGLAVGYEMDVKGGADGPDRERHGAGGRHRRDLAVAVGERRRAKRGGPRATHISLRSPPMRHPKAARANMGSADSARGSPDRVLVRVQRIGSAGGDGAAFRVRLPHPPPRTPAPGHGGQPMEMQGYWDGLWEFREAPSGRVRTGSAMVSNPWPVREPNSGRAGSAWSARGPRNGRYYSVRPVFFIGLAAMGAQQRFKRVMRRSGAFCLDLGMIGVLVHLVWCWTRRLCHTCARRTTLKFSRMQSQCTWSAPWLQIRIGLRAHLSEVVMYLQEHTWMFHEISKPVIVTFQDRI